MHMYAYDIFMLERSGKSKHFSNIFLSCGHTLIYHLFIILVILLDLHFWARLYVPIFTHTNMYKFQCFPQTHIYDKNDICIIAISIFLVILLFIAKVHKICVHKIIYNKTGIYNFILLDLHFPTRHLIFSEIKILFYFIEI